MRISVSNIAWQTRDDASVAVLLKTYGIDAIDVAPGKYFEHFADISAAETVEVRRWWSNRGIEIVGMQALLFGTMGLNLFADSAIRERMLAYLGHVCRIGQGLGAQYLVFGSPRNRDRGDLDDATTMGIARDFFGRLGDRAACHGVTICLEPNPPLYGANFMTDTESTLAVVRAVDHEAIRLQLDVGALTLNGENALEVLPVCAELVAHIHASEPGLKVLGDCGTDHESVSAAIRQFCPDRTVAIEMREDEDAPLASLERAIVCAKRSYGREEAS